MRAIITVVGKDMVGILAGVSAVCAKERVNVLEVTQSILQEFFCMVMLVDLEKASVGVAELEQKIEEGALGFKTNEGFQKWTDEEIAASRKNLTEGLIKVAKALDRL